MEYFLIVVLQLLGIGFHVMQKIVSIGEKHKDLSRSQIFSMFLFEDWDTLLVSGLVLITDLVVHFIVNTYAPAVREMVVHLPIVNVDVPFIIISFLIAFILGYAGQRLIYKFLGSTEKNIEKKIEALENK